MEQSADSPSLFATEIDCTQLGSRPGLAPGRHWQEGCTSPGVSLLLSAPGGAPGPSLLSWAPGCVSGSRWVLAVFPAFTVQPFLRTLLLQMAWPLGPANTYFRPPSSPGGGFSCFGQSSWFAFLSLLASL